MQFETWQRCHKSAVGANTKVLRLTTGRNYALIGKDGYGKQHSGIESRWDAYALHTVLPSSSLRQSGVAVV